MPHATDALATLEREAGGRLGVFALDCGNGETFGFRGDERFAFCSTFKAMLASAVLKRSESEAGLLQQRIRYASADLSNSPITQKHLADGMTVAELCAAAIQYSDNSAANLLIDLLGGPLVVTGFARSIGDTAFSLDRREPELNSAIPGDVRDTTTPEAMARSLQKLALGDALAAVQRKQLQDWLRGNTTGAKRIRAAVADNWVVGDKTGSGGDYGTTNDIGVLWPPTGAPIVMAIYFVQHTKDAAPRDTVVAQAARIALTALGRAAN